MQGKYPEKTYPTIACCGLDCGLCPTYYTKGPSRCPGCCGPEFFTRHPSCSIITCCVKKNKFETCAECNEFPCEKLKDWDKADSFICHQVSLTNLHSIKNGGIEEFMEQQEKRIKFLQTMLENFNEGRSKSFFCLAAALLPIENLELALKNSNEQIKREGIELNNLKARSKILKANCNQYAERKKIQLKLRKG
ncbi:MAG: DUF3795 domain-containing protein [Candidatus Hermodarchaeota archaeon]